MTRRRRKKHKPGPIVAGLRGADTMLNAGKDLAAVLKALEISAATFARWRALDRNPAAARTIVGIVPTGRLAPSR